MSLEDQQAAFDAELSALEARAKAAEARADAAEKKLQDAQGSFGSWLDSRIGAVKAILPAPNAPPVQ